MEQVTENPQQHISAAFDSVNLINQLIAEPIDDEKKSTVKRNVEHLEIMMGKDFFVTALTAEQKTQIEECIVNGNTYIS